MNTEMTEEELESIESNIADPTCFNPKEIKQIQAVFAQARQALTMERENEELRKKLDLFLKDWAEDDTIVRDVARPFLTPMEVDGDSNGVPGITDIVDSLAKKLAKQSTKP